MKTVNEIQEAALTGACQTTAMGMVLNATSFNHIISNLYKNPLGAILRELTTNALESHILANTTKRVAIQLPTDLEQELIIRDFGTGLTHEEVDKYLNTLFSTSKDGDNDLMGGFGLGSKSPLALVDSFNIISIKNGIKNSYTWIKEGGKLPSLVRFGDDEDWDETTDEDDGITISIPLGSSTKIHGNLQRVVEREARKQLFGFTKEKIMFVDNITTSSYDDLNDLTDNILKEVCLLDLNTLQIFKKDTSDYNALSYAVSVGGVIYPVFDIRSSFNGIVSLVKDSSEYIFVLKAPIGSLDIPMSREEVLDTHNNKSLLHDLVTQARVDLDDYFKSLNINLDCDLVEFYNQMATIKNTSTGKIQFNVDISDATFKKHERALLDAIESVASKQTLSYSTLQGNNLPNNLFEYLLKRDLITVHQYDSTNVIKEKVKYNYWSVTNNKLAHRDFDVIWTTSPIPKGATHNLIVEYAKQELGAKNSIMLVQCEPKLYPAIQRLVELLIAHAAAKDTGRVYTSLGEVDETKLTDFKATVKANNRVTKAPSTRLPSEYLIGIRMFNVGTCYLHANSTGSHAVSVQADDSNKVNKYIDHLGETIPMGPHYVKDLSNRKEVALKVAGKSSDLPINLKGFHNDFFSGHYYTNINQSYFTKLLTGLYSIEVPERSFQKIYDRFVEDGYTVYTVDSPLEITQPKLEDADLNLVGTMLLCRVMERVRSNLNLIPYKMANSLKLTYPLVRSAVEALPDTFFKKAIQERLKAKDAFEDLYSTHVDKLYLYIEKDLAAFVETIFQSVKEQFIQNEDNILYDNLYSLVSSSCLTREIVEDFLSRLILTKDSTDEIQVECDSAT